MTDESLRRSLAMKSLLVGAAQSALWALVLTAIVVTGGKVGQIVADFGMAVPVLSAHALAFSHFLQHFWYVPAACVALWPLVQWAVGAAFATGPESVGSRVIWYSLTWLAPVVVIAWATLAYLLPLVRLIDALS